jgi:catechol 2,3-dioxygenase-like lactoylglutathione lyase family enzyme
MLGKCKIIACVGATDLDRAQSFYEGILGLRFVKRDNFAIVFDANGIMFRVSRVEKVVAAPYTVLGWNVPDIFGTIEALEKHGVVFEQFPYLQQDKSGIWISPDKTMVAWFKDPDGNILSLSQYAS